MKKAICLMLSMLTCLTLVACSEKYNVAVVNDFAQTYSESNTKTDYNNNLNHLKSLCDSQVHQKLMHLPQGISNINKSTSLIIASGIDKNGKGYALVKINFNIGSPVIRLYKVTVNQKNKITSFDTEDCYMTSDN